MRRQGLSYLSGYTIVIFIVVFTIAAGGLLLIWNTQHLFKEFVASRRWLDPQCPVADEASVELIWHFIFQQIFAWSTLAGLVYATYIMSTSSYLRPALRLFTVIVILEASVHLVFAFAEAYADLGLAGMGNGAGDYVYFSAITFTTVGYGDFFPCPNARVIAAVEGFFGITLFPIMLGLFVSSN